jgi:hypothetical protein
MEKQLLPDAALEPAYDRVVWLYVFRDFSESIADRAAERISLRFGLTSWPQHLLVDPETLEVIGDTGRAVTSFLPAVDRAASRVTPSASLAAADRVRQADARAIELEKNPTADLVRESLGDPDIVVRFRALKLLVQTEPETVASRAPELLRVPNDPFRYAVCEVLAESPSADAVGVLHEIVAQPEHSRNPNVLRIRAVSALAACGDAKSVTVIAPFAGSGDYRNGLTGIAISALVTIAERKPAAEAAVCDVLKQSFPQPPDDSSASEQRPCAALAKRVHEALQRVTGEQVRFPAAFNTQTRETLIEKWREITATLDAPRVQ